MDGFHWQDGWFFKRLDATGAVRIRKYEGPLERSVLIGEAIIPAAEWASIVASVSALGETATAFAMFRAMQRGY